MLNVEYPTSLPSLHVHLLGFLFFFQGETMEQRKTVEKEEQEEKKEQKGEGKEEAVDVAEVAAEAAEAAEAKEAGKEEEEYKEKQTTGSTTKTGNLQLLKQTSPSSAPDILSALLTRRSSSPANIRSSKGFSPTSNN